MADAAVTTNPFSSLLARTPTPARLAAKSAVAIFEHPVPQEPNVLAFVVVGVRCFEIRGAHSTGPVAANWHQRDNQWHVLAEGVAFDAALATINRFVYLTLDQEPGWSIENDAWDIRALGIVRAGASNAVLPAAA